MPEYLVRWEIDITADNPRQAALLAREMQMPGSSALVFDVVEHHPPNQRGMQLTSFTRIDLAVGEEEDDEQADG